MKYKIVRSDQCEEGDELKVPVRCSNVNNLDLKYLEIRRVA